jgi:hypothetical protein
MMQYSVFYNPPIWMSFVLQILLLKELNKADKELHSIPQGFSGITDIAGGYAAWTQNGLPTSMWSVFAHRILTYWYNRTQEEQRSHAENNVPVL